MRDVSPAVESTWRWTYKRPELQFYLARTENLRFAMDFSIAGATFKDTGPVTLSVFVNGRFLHKQRYDQPGEKKMDVPVPPGMLTPEALNKVAIEPDKVWVSKEDGANLGFILSAAGFRQ